MKNLQDGIWLKEIPVEQHRVRITAAEEGAWLKVKAWLLSVNKYQAFTLIIRIRRAILPHSYCLDY